MLRPTDSVVQGEQKSPRNLPALAVHIHFYGPAEPIVLALPRARQSAAQAYYERVKSEVIEAQRHNEPRVSIRPFDRRRALLKLDPKTIQRVDLVDGLEPRPTPVVLTPPVPPAHELGARASTAADAASPDAGEKLSTELQRRIAILLG